MKSCQKCNRTYPDDRQKFCTFDGGLLVDAAKGFDPNATIASTGPFSPGGAPPQMDQSDLTATRDLNATIASRSMPTTNVSKPTGPTGSETIYDGGAKAQPPPSRSASLPQPVPSVAKPTSAPPAKKSKLPLILGIVLVLLVLGVGGVVALFVLVIKPQMDETKEDRPVVTRTNSNVNTATNDNANTAPAKPTTDDYVAPPDTTKFENSSANLDGKLAEHFVDFSFYYPDTWEVDLKAGVPGASNFVKVERRLPPDFTQENFAVGWYTSGGTFETDESTFPQLVEILGNSLARGFPEYRKVSQGRTKINSLDAYEFRFESVSRGTEKGDLNLWGRVVFLPPGQSGASNGATLILLATSLAPEVSGPNDVGERGEMPVILESFRFGKKP